MNDTCGCREAELLRAVAANEIPTPGTAMWRVLDGLVQAAAVARLRQLSHALAGDPYTGKRDGSDHWHRVADRRDILARRPITSVLPCSVCGAQVEVEHPLERWQFDLLPDVSWARCEAHEDVAA